MSDPVVGIDTILEGALPEQAANYGSLATFAAKTETDWTNELTTTETNRWNNGLIAGLYDGLEAGKPFMAALFQAIIHKAFEDVTDVFDNVHDAFDNMLSNFSGKWRDILAAQDAADYANAQLAVTNRAIVELFDGPAGDLSGSWNISYAGTLAGGKVQQDGRGNCWWDAFGGLARTAKCKWTDGVTETDLQIISTVMPLRVQDPKVGGESFLRIAGRLNNSYDTYVFAEITNDAVSVGCVNANAEHIFSTVSTATQNGDSWDFRIGSATDDYQFVLKRNGVTLIDVTDTGGAYSAKGSDCRRVGFVMHAADRNFYLSQTSPGKMAVFSADDQ